MGVMDQGMKAWMDLCRDALLPWVVGEPVEYLGTFPKEIAPASQLLPDSFYRVRIAGQLCLVNIEVQTDIDSSMGRRMFEYGARASTDSGLPVLSAVLWLFDKKKRPPKSPYQMLVGKRVVATWGFSGIELYRLAPSAIMNVGAVGLLPLVPFTKGATPEVIETALERVKNEAPAEQVEPLVAFLGLFTSRFYGMDLALDLFRRIFMSTEIMEEFPLFRHMMAEAETKGRLIGELEGLREGARIGLESRFGQLSEDVQQALEQADETTLRELLAHLAFDSLEQLRERLGLNGQPQ